MRFGLLVGAACAVVAAAPASAADVMTYKILSTLTETRTIDDGSHDEPQTTITYYGPQVFTFNFDVKAPHHELYGDYEEYDLSAYVYGSQLILGSGPFYPGYGTLDITINFDHDLGGKFPIAERAINVVWRESASHYGYSYSVVGSNSRFLAVPEPTTWAMMLAGFGMIGFAARRRQSIATTVTYA